MNCEFTPAYRLRKMVAAPDMPILCLFPRGMIFVALENGCKLRLPRVAELSGVSGSELYGLGTMGGTPCVGLKVADENAVVPGAGCIQKMEFKAALMQLPEAEHKLLLRGKMMLEWLARNRFCGVCGALLENSEQEEARCCPTCGAKFFPKISPAVIVLVTRGDEILLAHNEKFRGNIYSLIAGFVEPGESVEAAIAREIREEVGIEVKEVCYQGSQSWPFPDSLMLGFTAKYASGEVRPDGVEITDAAFFPADKLPELPGTGSIARRIINSYLASHGQPGAAAELEYQ